MSICQAMSSVDASSDEEEPSSQEEEIDEERPLFYLDKTLGNDAIISSMEVRERYFDGFELHYQSLPGISIIWYM